LHMDLRGRFEASMDNWSNWSIRQLVVLFSSPKDETRRNFTTSWHINVNFAIISPLRVTGW
jgi:hypothetical protein